MTLEEAKAEAKRRWGLLADAVQLQHCCEVGLRDKVFPGMVMRIFGVGNTFELAFDDADDVAAANRAAIRARGK